MGHKVITALNDRILFQILFSVVTEFTLQQVKDSLPILTNGNSFPFVFTVQFNSRSCAQKLSELGVSVLLAPQILFMAKLREF